MIKKIALAVVAVMLTGAAAAYSVYKIFYPGERRPALSAMARQEAEEIPPAAGRTVVALLGVDKREDDKGRSDAIILVFYDPAQDKLHLLSVPRDMRMRLPGLGWDKINHSYGVGGAPAVLSALEGFFGIPIDYYMELDFAGFEKIVDALGGVEIDIGERMYYSDPWDGPDGLVIDFQPGRQLLDGQKAMHFVRYRDEDGDLGRVKRQQEFLTALYGKALSPQIWRRLPELAGIIFEAVETNMSVFDMLKLAKTAHSSIKAGIESATLTGEPVFIDSINYLLPDVSASRAEAWRMFGLDASAADFNRATERLTQAYAASLPDNVVYWYDEETAESKDSAEETVLAKETLPLDAAPPEAPASGSPPEPAGKPGSALFKPKPSLPAKIASSAENTPKPAPATPKHRPQPARPPAPRRAEEEKPAASPPLNEQHQTPRLLRAAVVNCSGKPDSAAKMARLLADRGITVLTTSEGEPRNYSSIVANTNDGWIVSKLASLPFRYSLRLRAGDDGVDAVVFVGRDFS
jgi:LCP family protein required for cell wall assembly